MQQLLCLGEDVIGVLLVPLWLGFHWSQDFTLMLLYLNTGFVFYFKLIL